MSDDEHDNPYIIGDAHPRRQDFARFYTKPSTYTGRWNTGSGYELWRSREERGHTPGDGKDHVYVAVHRLCAVAWLLPEDAPLSALDGVDVHHTSGVPWDNREDALELLDHGRHSKVTQAEMRSWAEDAKRQADAGTAGDPDRCVRCGETPDAACESADWDGVACLECSQALADGAAIEVVE